MAMGRDGVITVEEANDQPRDISSRRGRNGIQRGFMRPRYMIV